MSKLFCKKKPYVSIVVSNALPQDDVVGYFQLLWWALKSPPMVMLSTGYLVCKSDIQSKFTIVSLLVSGRM